MDNAKELNPVLKAWRPVIARYRSRVALGLITFVTQGESDLPKPPEQLLTEIGMVRQTGSNGFIIFDLGRASDEQLAALRSLASTLPAAP